MRASSSSAMNFATGFPSFTLRVHPSRESSIDRVHELVGERTEWFAFWEKDRGVGFAVQSTARSLLDRPRALRSPSFCCR